MRTMPRVRIRSQALQVVEGLVLVVDGVVEVAVEELVVVAVPAVDDVIEVAWQEKVDSVRDPRL